MPTRLLKLLRHPNSIFRRILVAVGLFIFVAGFQYVAKILEEKDTRDAQLKSLLLELGGKVWPINIGLVVESRSTQDESNLKFILANIFRRYDLQFLSVWSHSLGTSAGCDHIETYSFINPLIGSHPTVNVQFCQSRGGATLSYIAYLALFLIIGLVLMVYIFTERTTKQKIELTKEINFTRQRAHNMLQSAAIIRENYQNLQSKCADAALVRLIETENDKSYSGWYDILHKQRGTDIPNAVTKVYLSQLIRYENVAAIKKFKDCLLHIDAKAGPFAEANEIELGNHLRNFIRNAVNSLDRKLDGEVSVSLKTEGRFHIIEDVKFLVETF